MSKKSVDEIQAVPPFEYETHPDHRGFRDLIGREVSVLLRFPTGGRRADGGHLLIVDARGICLGTPDGARRWHVLSNVSGTVFPRDASAERAHQAVKQGELSGEV